jgi:hypothetical protein
MTSSMTRFSPLRLVALALAVALLAASPSAAGAATVRGKVVKGRGMTVVAVAPDGDAASKRLPASGRFKLRLPRGRGTTLHLVGRAGRYYGPLVLARAGKRVYQALAGRSGKLGTFRLGRGFARPRGAVGARLIDRGRVARANRSGRPVGAGRLGLVRSRQARGAQVGGDGAPGADSDRDGLAGPFDVDDDGDGTLDGADADAEQGGDVLPHFSSHLRLEFPNAANASAGGSQPADALLRSDSFFLTFRLGGGATRRIRSVDVNCFQLAYCRPGSGSAEVVTDFGEGGGPPGQPAHGTRWVDYDPDRDGLPNLFQDDGEFRLFGMNTNPRATRAQLSPGDSYEFRIDGDGVPSSVMASLDYVFLSTPAVQSYDAGAGPVTMSYPAADGAPGTVSNPIRLMGNTLRLSAWRPQREPIPGAERSGLINMGGLGWGVKIALHGPVVGCEAADFSGLSPTLRPATWEEGTGPRPQLEDTAHDAPASASSTVSFTIDLGACLSRHGIAPAGQVAMIDVDANDRRGAEATQALFVCLPGGTGECRLPAVP